MLSFAAGKKVNLPSSRCKGSGILATHPKEDELGYVPEIETDATAVRAAVLSDLVPDEVAFVFESPGFHNRDTIGQQRVRNPKIQVGSFRREDRNGQGLYAFE